MKKLVSMILACIFLLLMVGCNASSVKESPLLKEGKVTEVHISTYPGSLKLTLTEREEIKELVDYFANLNLTAEDPGVLIGMSYDIILQYDDGTDWTIGLIGIFVQAENGERYRIPQEEARLFEELCEKFKK